MTSVDKIKFKWNKQNEWFEYIDCNPKKKKWDFKIFFVWMFWIVFFCFEHFKIPITKLRNFEISKYLIDWKHSIKFWFSWFLVTPITTTTTTTTTRESEWCQSNGYGFNQNNNNNKIYYHHRNNESIQHRLTTLTLTSTKNILTINLNKWQNKFIEKPKQKTKNNRFLVLKFTKCWDCKFGWLVS